MLFEELHDADDCQDDCKNPEQKTHCLRFPIKLLQLLAGGAASSRAAVAPTSIFSSGLNLTAPSRPTASRTPNLRAWRQRRTRGRCHGHHPDDPEMRVPMTRSMLGPDHVSSGRQVLESIASYQTDQGDRCVDIFSRPDGSFGFEEFRKDPEDMGAWTPVGYFSAKSFPSSDVALADATRRVAWLSDLLIH